MTPSPSPADRFEPRAAQPMASMFDEVSGRYDLINALMTLGQDGAWRATLAATVPERARVVLDLCTGNGASLHGLTRPGRLVVGADVSMGMLEHASASLRSTGWSPRLACADAFQLPIRDRSVDAVTVAFGIRNLRPRALALAELRRVMAPGGVLAVLEACAPRPGWFAPMHRFHLRHLVPMLGRLSRDPSAYLYLRDSILEFGDGRPFENDLRAAGFTIDSERTFLIGATRLWVARAPAPPGALQDARKGGSQWGELPHGGLDRGREWRVWRSIQLVLSALLAIGLGIGFFQYISAGKNLPLVGWRYPALGILLAGGCVGFAARALLLALARGGTPPRR